jgi:hypothetical protein
MAAELTESALLVQHIRRSASVGAELVESAVRALSASTATELDGSTTDAREFLGRFLQAVSDRERAAIVERLSQPDREALAGLVP